MAPHKEASAGARRRAAALVLLLMLLCGPLARIVHQIAVPHRLCQVHGTIEHGPQTSTSPLSDRVSPAECLPETSMAGSTDDGPRYLPGPEAHEECEVACFTRSEEVLPLEAPRASVFLIESSGTNFLRQTLTPRSPLYREAPSRSPPA